MFLFLPVKKEQERGRSLSLSLLSSLYSVSSEIGGFGQAAFTNSSCSLSIYIFSSIFPLSSFLSRERAPTPAKGVTQGTLVFVRTSYCSRKKFHFSLKGLDTVQWQLGVSLDGIRIIYHWKREWRFQLRSWKREKVNSMREILKDNRQIEDYWHFLSIRKAKILINRNNL